MLADVATWKTVQGLAKKLPGAEESTHYGTPAFKVKGRMFVRLKENGTQVVVHMPIAERVLLVEFKPKVFVVTPHYEKHPYVLVELEHVERGELADLLEDSWRIAAPKRLLAAHDAKR
jgi:hypothetical protein